MQITLKSNQFISGNVQHYMNKFFEDLLIIFQVSFTDNQTNKLNVNSMTELTRRHS